MSIVEIIIAIKVALAPWYFATTTEIIVVNAMFRMLIQTRIPVSDLSKDFKRRKTLAACLSPLSLRAVIFNSEQDEKASSMLQKNADIIKNTAAIVYDAI